MGVIALIQVAFLPGYLALSVFRVRRGSVIETAAVSLSLSLLINYTLVFAFSAAGVYNRTSVLAFLAAEALVAGFLLVRAATRSHSIETRLPALRQAEAWKSALVVVVATVFGAFGIQALRTSAHVSVFNFWDPIFSWNRWAMTWYGGAVPLDSKLYPQLIPANWSLMYHIMGTPEIQSIPLALMPVFVVALLALFFDLAIRRGRVEYLVALLVCAGALFAVRARVSLASGHVDMAVAFMTAVSFYLVELREDRRLGDWRALALPLICATAAGVTKFNGLLAVIVVLALALWGHAARRRHATRAELAKSVGLVILSLGAVLGTWYGMKLYEIVLGLDSTYYADLSQATASFAGGSDIATRLLHAESLVPGAWLSIAVLGLVIWGSVRLPRTRWVALGILVPYTILWAVFLSYDLRNELVMVPVVAYLVGFVCVDVASRFVRDVGSLRVTSYRTRAMTGPVAVGLVAVGLVSVAVASLAFPATALEARNIELQRSVGSPALDRDLYAADARLGGVRGELLTDYLYFDYLPHFRSSVVRREHTVTIHALTRVSADITPRDLDGRDWLLLSDELRPETLALVDARVRDGSYSVVFEEDVLAQDNAYLEPTRVRLIRVNR